MTAKTNKGLMLLAATVVLASLVGCQEQGNHEKWVQEGEQRYNAVRSGIMLPMAIQALEAGDLNEAERQVREALSIDPTNARLHVVGGRVAFERGQLERAYHLFNVAIGLDNDLAEAHYFLAIVYQRWQQYENAHKSYAEAYRCERDNPAYLLAMSEMLVNLDRLVEATELLEAKLNYFDQNPGIRAALGHLHTMAEAHKTALSYFRQAALLDPDNLKLQEEFAMSQIAAGDYAGGVTTLRRLLSSDEMTDRYDLQRAMAVGLERQGDLRQASVVYGELTRSGGQTVQDWIKFGECSWKLKDVARTLHAANRVINLAPDRHEGYLMAGMVWQKRGRLDDALRMFDHAADRAPHSSAPLILRGISLQRAGKFAAARTAYEEAIIRQPDDRRAHRLLQSVAEVAP